MTPEFGAASQLEKIDMLDFADVVAINKFERRGAKDALRDVGRQLVRNREAFGKKPEDMPVFGTSAATFNDDGVTALYQHLISLLGARRARRSRRASCRSPTYATPAASTRSYRPSAPATSSEITETVRGYHADDRRSSPSRPAACSASTRCRRELDSSGTSSTRCSPRLARSCPPTSPRRSRAGPPSSSRTRATRWSSTSAAPRTVRR